MVHKMVSMYFLQLNNNSYINHNVVTKKYALQNKDKCCAVKKLGNNIGSITNNINVAALDYIFVECEDKDKLEEHLKRALFNNTTILNKTNFSNYIN